MPRHRQPLAAWREFRAAHYSDGEPRDCELGALMRQLLATKRGAVALLRADRRYAKCARPQHTSPHPANAGWAHAAYGRKHGKAPR